MDGVNHELGPFLRMTYPAEAARLDPASVPIGTRAFRSWMLLFGLLPVDWDDLTFERFEPGRGFRERSSMLTQRTWCHERTLEPVPGGTRVTDRLAWEGRVPGATAMFGLVVPWLFRWRHRRLAGCFRPSADAATREQAAREP